MGKFTILFVSTLGIYGVVWLYLNWMAYEKVTGKRVFKFGRTVFSVFFIHDLYYTLDKKNRALESPFPWSPSVKAWVFISAGIVELIVALVGDAQGWRGPSFTLAGLVLARFISFYSMYTAQLVINRTAGDPYGQSNRKLSMSNQLFIVLGFYLWFSFFYEIYLETTGQLPQPVNSAGSEAVNTPTPGPQ